MAQKPGIPKGTRDFGPVEMLRRNYIFDTIKEVFQLYGYLPIETPSMENLSTLMGKYGEEGDKLLFKVLNSGDFMKKTSDDVLQQKNSIKITNQISEKGLRYDLTVPFARYVVQHQNEISFPFKRYQIQPVWRADRPQRGRYREFYQCDADVIGSNSLLNEIELVQIIDEVFNRLNLGVLVKINNRKILAGIAEIIGHPDKIIDITVAIDKLDKIGLEKVNQEMIDNGIPQEAVDKLQPIIQLQGTTFQKLETLSEILKESEIGLKGIEELSYVFKGLELFDINTEVELDLTLARGLNYYTGAIFEVKALDVSIGSICGGGRYDDLTGIFGLKDVSGVGISFGADRIYDVLQEKSLFPDETRTSTRALFINFGEAEQNYCLPVLAKLRALNLRAQLYPDTAKMKKQMNFANTNNIPFVIMVGSNEMEQGLFTVKSMDSGEQKTINFEQLVAMIS
ncbi:MAG: histidine--tRNA ligase [Bacteroidales bacterium]|nr:histidine--tRNA ligase [Bacteroidales bacterium]